MFLFVFLPDIVEPSIEYIYLSTVALYLLIYTHSDVDFKDVVETKVVLLLPFVYTLLPSEAFIPVTSTELFTLRSFEVNDFVIL